MKRGNVKDDFTVRDVTVWKVKKRMNDFLSLVFATGRVSECVCYCVALLMTNVFLLLFGQLFGAKTCHWLFYSACNEIEGFWRYLCSWCKQDGSFSIEKCDGNGQHEVLCQMMAIDSMVMEFGELVYILN